MATLKTDHLSLMQRGRLDKVLAKRARYDGVVRTLAEHVATLQGVKRESDGGCDFNRSRFNRMTGDEQRAYEARLDARRYYTIDGYIVPKIVYDCVEPAEA